MSMPHIASLDEHLAEHVVEVTEQGDVLKVLTYPATEAAWELTFDVNAADEVANTAAWTLESPPR